MSTDEGRIYVSSWRDGGFNYSRPDVGYVVRVVAEGIEEPKFPDLKAASKEKLADDVGGGNAVLRLAAQRELLRRGFAGDQETISRLMRTAMAKSEPMAARAAAIFTLAQEEKAAGIPALLNLDRSSPEVLEFLIKAVADRRQAWTRADDQAVARHLSDSDPRVRLQAAVALGRRGQVENAPAILPLTADMDPLVSHVAVKALVNLHAYEACLKGLGDPKFATGASLALQAMHDPKVVSGLTKLVGGSTGAAGRKAALKALCRLYHAEAPYVGQVVEHPSRHERSLLQSRHLGGQSGCRGGPPLRLETVGRGDEGLAPRGDDQEQGRSSRSRRPSP